MKLLTTSLLTLVCTPAFAEVHVVLQKGYDFVPQTVDAMPGDTIRWQWGNGNHTVVDADLADPCTEVGALFDLPVTEDDPIAEWIIPEDVSGEVYYICDVGNHCAFDMVGYINVGGEEELADLEIGLVDIDCYFRYSKDSDGNVQAHFSELWNDKVSRASFVWGMESNGEDEDGNPVDSEIYINASTDEGGHLYVHRASDGSETPLVTGPMTLEAGEKYLFHGSCNYIGEFSLDLEWTEEYISEDETSVIVSVEGDGSVSSAGDNFLMRASNDHWASITWDVVEETELPILVVGDVACSTAALPANGEDGTVTLPVGMNTIEVAAGTTQGLLMLRFDQGDEGGGGDDGLPADVNGDCVVDVSDVLAIISAWGATCP